MIGTKTNNTSLNVVDIVNNYSDDLYRFAFSKTRNQVISEDLVQETFMVLIAKKDSFRGESSPKTWLISILKNKISDYYRKKMRDKISDKDISDHTESFDDTDKWSNDHKPFVFEDEGHLLDNPDFNLIFNNCIDSLPEIWSSVVRLKYIDPKKSKEICKELNITDTNLWQIVHRAKLKLKDCLQINWINKGN